MKAKEERIRELYKKYQAGIKLLEKEYDDRFDNVPVNEAGEADAEYILKTNEWYDTTRKHLDKCFWKAVAKVF